MQGVIWEQLTGNNKSMCRQAFSSVELKVLATQFLCEWPSSL